MVDLVVSAAQLSNNLPMSISNKYNANSSAKVPSIPGHLGGKGLAFGDSPSISFHLQNKDIAVRNVDVYQ